MTEIALVLILAGLFIGSLTAVLRIK